jgi:hypothetical protein
LPALAMLCSLAIPITSPTLPARSMTGRAAIAVTIVTPL